MCKSVAIEKKYLLWNSVQRIKCFWNCRFVSRKNGIKFLVLSRSFVNSDTSLVLASYFSIEVIQTDNHIPQCEPDKLGKLKWLDNRGSGLESKLKVNGKSLDGEKNKSIRQNILVEQETRLLTTKKLMLASNLGNNFERKNTCRNNFQFAKDGKMVDAYGTSTWRLYEMN